MSLNRSTLQSGILAVCSGPGSSVAACAQQWADAVAGYAENVVPASTTVATAKAALVTALGAAFATFAPPGMEQAFREFAVTVGGGMAGFVAAPPPGQVGFASLALPPAPATHEDAAARAAALIDAWFRTGTATPPNGSPIAWS